MNDWDRQSLVRTRDWTVSLLYGVVGARLDNSRPGLRQLSLAMVSPLPLLRRYDL